MMVDNCRNIFSIVSRQFANNCLLGIVVKMIFKASVFIQISENHLKKSAQVLYKRVPYPTEFSANVYDD